VPRVVVDEGNEVSASAKTNVLRRPPYVGISQIDLVTAPITIVGEQKSVLLPELAGFTNLCGVATKFGQTENHMFRLQVLKPPKVDVADPLVPQVDIRLGFLSLREQGGVGSIVSTVEDKHPPVFASSRNNPAFLLDEGSEVCKSDLHSLVDDLSDRDQVLRNRRNVQHVHKFPFLSDAAQGNFSDVRNLVRSVVSSRDYSGGLRFLQVRKPLLMTRHVI
jgi:hypothetical protein